MVKMATGDRASREVAEHFFKKYGCAQATEIISARLSGDDQVSRTEFWQDVLTQLSEMDSMSKSYDVYAGSQEGAVRYPPVK